MSETEINHSIKKYRVVRKKATVIGDAGEVAAAPQITEIEIPEPVPEPEPEISLITPEPPVPAQVQLIKDDLAASIYDEIMAAEVPEKIPKPTGPPPKSEPFVPKPSKPLPSKQAEALLREYNGRRYEVSRFGLTAKFLD